MIDTLQNILDTVKASSNNGLDVLEKVDTFYNNAWNKLIIVGSVAITIVGVVVPLIIQWYQKRTLKLSEELLKKNFETQMASLKEKVIEDLSQDIDDKFLGYEKKIKILNAKSSLMQGKLSLEKNYHRIALGDIIAAAFGFISCDDYQNLQNALNLILNECLPNLSQEEINDLRIVSDSDIDALLKILKESDDKGVFITHIQDIKLKITKLPKTVKEKPQEQPKKDSTTK